MDQQPNCHEDETPSSVRRRIQDGNSRITVREFVMLVVSISGAGVSFFSSIIRPMLSKSNDASAVRDEQIKEKDLKTEQFMQEVRIYNATNDEKMRELLWRIEKLEKR